MVGSSKILTVSYGTFSCTLEGFDDPFSAMRSIAEYFRDLAAEDRYFGAEPPTPDADMLHEIAQRGVQRRVEVTPKADGLVLRQVTDETPASAPEAETPVADVVERHYAEDEEAAAIAAMEAEPGRPTIEPQTGDTVAAKLSRIRAVVAGNSAAALAARSEDRFAGSIDAAFADDTSVEDAEVVEQQLDIHELETAPEAESAPEIEVPAFVPEEEAVAERHDQEVEAAEVESAGETEAEDAESNVTPMFPADAPEVEAAQPTPSVTKLSMAEDLAADDPMTADANAYPEVAADPDEVPAMASDDETKKSASDSMGLAARIVMLKQAALKAPEPYVDATSDITSDGGEIDLEHDRTEPSLEAAIDEALTFEDDDPENAPVADEELSDPLADSREAIKAAIVRVAELEKESAPDDADDVEPAARRQTFEDGDNEELSLKRILEQTNSRMDDTEGSRRRSAIAHLKAAVAATKADRALKPDTDVDSVEEQSQYRDDLARVVQAPPQSETPATSDDPSPEVPVETASADADDGPEHNPLVLVSEQRVSDADDAHAIDEDLFDNEGFAEFASKVGASDLPDLLEAAAAYTAFIEGNKLFSRPQLMRRVAHLDSRQEFSREAGLRSFGQLLRQGKIQKLKRGQFTISEDTRFNPQERLAGQ